MKLQDKIEEIRKKPEHIRMRYVWGCVIVSMFLVIVLWIFSLTAGRVSNNDGGLTESQVMQKFQTQKQSMSDYKNQLKDMQNSLKDIQNQAQDEEENQNADNTDIPDNANEDSNQDFINSNQ